MIRVAVIIFNPLLRQNTAKMLTNLSDFFTVLKILVKEHMHANSIKPAEVNVNNEMIVSVNFSFTGYKTYLLHKTDKKQKKTKH